MSQIQIPASISWAHPLIQEWFASKFGTPTEPQEAGWPHILAHRTTLISAPTGSGKTLTAFLACIDELVRKSIEGRLEDRTEVLYVSPLKALGNDIQKNLEAPLAEIMQLAAERGYLMPQVRTMVRTGDTPNAERQKFLRKPPHILVTTPESLYILLTAEKSRQVLRDVRTVIVDEIHAVADDKRGAHLALSLERLDHLVAEQGAKPPVRIGLSATQKPIETVAHFLTGSAGEEPAIVNVGHQRKLDLAVEVPSMELGPVASNDLWDEIYDRIAELANEHRSTLVFVNTRAMAERVAHNLAERLGDENVAAHHGSLSRKLRLQAEQKLKNGEIKALVATASLELGIDIGTVDLVCHINSPRSIAVTLQRVGRAGHWRGAIPKGRLFATTRDDLIELAAAVRAIKRGDLDQLVIPEKPLDILAQQIVAMCAAEEWDEDALFAVARRAYPYRDLERKEYDELIVMLSEGIVARRGRYGSYLHRDQVNRRLKARRGGRLVAITNGGAIPDNALFTVIAEPEGVPVGTIDEDFAVESSRGEILLLGNTSWRIRRIEGTGRMFVEDAHGAPPTIPFWRGEAPGRTFELSKEVSDLRKLISDMTPRTSPGFVFNSQAAEVVETREWLRENCGLSDSAAEQVIEYIISARAILRAIPTQECVIAERFFDEGGGMQLIIHAPFGQRINKAWGLSLRKKFCRSFNFELQAAATDNGINIALAEQHSFPLADVFEFLHESNVQEALEQAALPLPVFKNRFRWDAQRALQLIRFRNGKKVPPQIQRMQSDDLLASVFPDAAACQENINGPINIPDHPLVREVMKDVLHEAMDIDGLREILRKLDTGDIKIMAVDTPQPSVFTHEILNANPYAYLDDAPLEERRARAVQMRQTLPAAVVQEIGRLDPAAIEEVRNEAWPDVRDPDELHDALQTFIALPEGAEPFGHAPAAAVWDVYFEALRSRGRATRALVPQEDGKGTTSVVPYHDGALAPKINGAIFWVATEKLKAFRAIYPQAQIQDEVPEVTSQDISADDALLAMVTGWLMHSGPTTAARLGELLVVPAREITKALLRMEAAGSALRGQFENQWLKPAEEETEWCERRLLARIHRLTIATLRKQIEPTTAATFMHWLAKWQHAMPGTQLIGERGLRQVLQQLQGFEIPANAWERQVLARRVRDYKPEMLDQLCLTGQVGWGRLSPHPATLEATSTGARRVVPTSVAPITFFLRDEDDWMMSKRGDESSDGYTEGLSSVAFRVHEFLKQRGASFFTDIVRGASGDDGQQMLKAEVETALWELVAAGLVTADGFDNLRSLIDPKRRAGEGRGKTARPRHSAGRWSLLYAHHAPTHQAMLEATCRMLLARYGVVFRELLTRESLLPKWRELLITFRRLEDRGELRGGRFVTGFIGEQFALPEAVESLRATRRELERASGAEPAPAPILTLSAADPLNLIGIVIAGERVPAISGKYISFKNGIPVDAAETVLPIKQEASGD
jgi:ATP-dependent Lhr-like helicase